MYQDDIKALESFLFTLEWILAVTTRHSGSLQFGLAHINFENSRLIGETFGAVNASQKLDEISHALRKAFRKTDLVARVGVDFWMLVPYTPADETLMDKIKYILETATQGGLEIVERDISIFSLPIDVADLCEGCSALEFLTHLKKNHIALARHEISLPASA